MAFKKNMGGGKKKDGTIILGSYFPSGDFIVFQNPDIYWEKLYPTYPLVRPQSELIQQYGLENAKLYSYAILAGTVVSHELIHKAQDLSLPELFYESGARYYQYNLADGNTRNLLLQQQDIKMINYYDSLVKKYGEPVHKMNFGQSINPITKIRILNNVKSQKISPSRS